jgi:hypothetical protein
VGGRLKEFYCTVLQYFVVVKFSHAIIQVVDTGFITFKILVGFVVGKIVLCQ